MHEIEADLSELKATTHRRLNVGSGDYPLRYHLNLDADPEKNPEICATVPPIPLEDESLDDVWACHFLEHLSYEAALAFLAECYRVLVPGGKLSIVVPDTREIMQRWLAGTIDAVEFGDKWWPIADLNAVNALFLYSTVQDSPHLWAWDLNTLARAMDGAGFGEFESIDRFEDQRIIQGAWYQCGLIGKKPEKTVEGIAEELFGGRVCEVCGAPATGHSSDYQDKPPEDGDMFVKVDRVGEPHFYCKEHPRLSLSYDYNGHLREPGEMEA